MCLPNFELQVYFLEDLALQPKGVLELPLLAV
jgi:hypothetical protein